MAKKNMKYYSPEEKAFYHSRRVKKAIDKGKRENEFNRKEMYSTQWLTGYSDKHSDVNAQAAADELNYRRRNKLPFNDYDVMLTGYKNGCAERNKKLKRGKRNGKAKR